MLSTLLLALCPLHVAQQTPIIYKADNKMLSKNTTRGARHGQPELNAARLRNAQQVKERERGRGREREAERRNCS